MANRSQWCGLWPIAQAPTSWRTIEARWWWRRRSRRSLTGFWCPSTSRWAYSCDLWHPATCFLQVDNPIAVLNQDTAKTFLFKCDPDKLYTFFMRATQVQYLELSVWPQNWNKKVSCSWSCVKPTTTPPTLRRAQPRAIWRRRSNPCRSWKGNSPSTNELIVKQGFSIFTSRWEKKYEFHQNLNVRRNDVKKKKGELAWAVVRDADLEALKLEKDAEDQGKKVIGSLLWLPLP